MKWAFSQKNVLLFLFLKEGEYDMYTKHHLLSDNAAQKPPHSAAYTKAMSVARQCDIVNSNHSCPKVQHPAIVRCCRCKPWLQSTSWVHKAYLLPGLQQISFIRSSSIQPLCAVAGASLGCRAQAGCVIHSSSANIATYIFDHKLLHPVIVRCCRCKPWLPSTSWVHKAESWV